MKIITIENPIEYHVDGIVQTQVDVKKGYTFLSGLRAALRQDPDVIMVGEIRDSETASIAANSALTGHLVLSTIHTNSAAGGITRLIDMGVEDYLLTSTINGLLAQRLTRRLDKSSMEKYPVMPEMVEELKLNEISDEKEFHFYRPKPSEENPTGYGGRLSILECLTMTEEIRRLVMKGATAGELQRQAQAEGMLTMYQDGLLKCMVGDTSFEEVIRVSHE